MSNLEKLEVGDIVRVEFNNANHTLCKEAMILHIPSATGESWIFREIERFRKRDSNDIIGYKLHYVSEGCTVTLIQKNHDNIR